MILQSYIFPQSISEAHEASAQEGDTAVSSSRTCTTGQVMARPFFLADLPNLALFAFVFLVFSLVPGVECTRLSCFQTEL